MSAPRAAAQLLRVPVPSDGASYVLAARAGGARRSRRFRFASRLGNQDQGKATSQEIAAVKRPEGRTPAQNLGWDAKHVGCHYRRNAQRYSAVVVASPR